MEKQKRIKYFSYYGCNDPLRLRGNSPAADSKIDYIISVLNKCGYAVDLISCACSTNKHFQRGYIEKKNNGNTLRFFDSLGKGNKLIRIIDYFFMKVQFIIWCLLNLHKYENIIVYHSLGYAAIFLKLFKFKRLHIIGEVEEIYQDVHEQSQSLSDSEYKFIDICDKYVFPTSLLNDKLNKKNKPNVIVHGVYSTENSFESKFDDGKIHIVYGGTLDPQKGGAAAAAAAAEFLPENYYVHICGFGDPTQIKEIIVNVAARSKAKVVFEGELKGNEYKKFIQKCHIGLSTQNPHSAFNATSFPSKILVYLSNGLKVVSIRIPAIAQSAIAGNLFFYDVQTPENIAKTIVQASQNELCNDNILKKLDAQFENELKKIIEE